VTPAVGLWNGHPVSLTVINSSYIIARMRYAIILAPEAVEDFKGLTANSRGLVRTAIETHLRHEPEKTSRSRIKQLRGIRRPRFRLRVGDIRVFYDVTDSTVEVLAIVAKSEAEKWLTLFASPA
jgi:mRNA interferase RelE/StbE